MKNSFLSYTLHYIVAFCLFLLCLLMERYGGLLSLSLWFLFYLLLRGVSFALVFSLSIFFDAAFLHAFGSSSLLISVQYLLIQFARGKRMGKLFQWGIGVLLIAFTTMMRRQTFLLPFRFWLISLFFLFLMLFGVRMKDVWYKKKYSIYGFIP